MKYLFVINRHAGKSGVHKKLAQELRALCSAAGLDFALHITDSAEEAGEVIRTACAVGEPIRVYACGGDGTFSVAVNAAAEYPHAALGVIPIGTGNDFIRNFGKHAQFSDCAAQLDAHEVELDMLRCNDRYCANMINVGFDCEVVKQASRLRRKRFFGEKLAYISGVIATLIRKPGVNLTASLDGETEEEKRLLLIAVANGAFCGGGFRAAPRSMLTDGNMDICMVNNISRTRFVSLVKHYHDGTYLKLRIAKKIIGYRQGETLSLRFPAMRSVCIDGELTETDHLDISIVPHSLRFLLPRGIEWTEEAGHEAADPV